MIILEEKHKASFLIGIVFIVLGFIGKVFYREYINSHGIDDFGIAGSLPSFMYVIGFSQLLQIRPIKYPWLVVLVVSAGSIIYEFKQSSGSATVDINDIIASVLGGAVSLFILYIVGRKYKNKNSSPELF